MAGSGAELANGARRPHTRTRRSLGGWGEGAAAASAKTSATAGKALRGARGRDARCRVRRAAARAVRSARLWRSRALPTAVERVPTARFVTLLAPGSHGRTCAASGTDTGGGTARLARWHGPAAAMGSTSASRRHDAGAGAALVARRASRQPPYVIVDHARRAPTEVALARERPRRGAKALSQSGTSRNSGARTTASPWSTHGAVAFARRLSGARERGSGEGSLRREVRRAVARKRRASAEQSGAVRAG